MLDGLLLDVRDYMEMDLECRERSEALMSGPVKRTEHLDTAGIDHLTNGRFAVKYEIRYVLDISKEAVLRTGNPLSSFTPDQLEDYESEEKIGSSTNRVELTFNPGHGCGVI